MEQINQEQEKFIEEIDKKNTDYLWINDTLIYRSFHIYEDARWAYYASGHSYDSCGFKHKRDSYFFRISDFIKIIDSLKKDRIANLDFDSVQELYYQHNDTSTDPVTAYVNLGVTACSIKGNFSLGSKEEIIFRPELTFKEKQSRRR